MGEQLELKYRSQRAELFRSLFAVVDEGALTRELAQLFLQFFLQQQEEARGGAGDE